MGRRRGGIPGLSFSWKRAAGISSAKRKVSKAIGVPLTKSGRRQKVGRAMGCCIPAAFVLLAVSATGYGIRALIRLLI